MKKKYYIILFILAGVAILLIVKWHTWFVNPPETAYTTPDTQDRIILSAGEDATTTRRISWRCGTQRTDAHAEIVRESDTDTIRIEAKGDVISSRAGLSAFYNVEIPDLQAGSTYHYRLINGNRHSSWYSFQISPKDSPLSFIYLGDIQDKLTGNTGTIFKNIHQRFPDVDFWACVGDVIERPTDKYWSYWFGTMDNITQHMPILVATGNHEYLKGVIKTLDPRWTHTFSFPENGPGSFKGRSYFVNYKDLCFITIDTDGIQGIASLWQQRAWLKKVLENSDKKWKIVMMHHPVYSVRNGRNNIFFRYAFRPLFEEYNVDLVLQGHDHGYSRISTKEENGEERTPVYIVSTCSPKHYDVSLTSRHDKLGSAISLYQHIQIAGDSLSYRSFTVADSLYDDILIVHKDGKNQVTDNARGIPEQLELPKSTKIKGNSNIQKYEDYKKERIERLNAERH